MYSDFVLCNLINEKVELVSEHIFIYMGRLYPIYKGIYIFLNPIELPVATRDRLKGISEYQPYFADWMNIQGAAVEKSIQTSFSEEWTQFDKYLKEFDDEFDLYFDLVEKEDYQGKIVLDLGCGIGRWASYLVEHVACMVCVDFSEAIFVTADKLGNCPNCHFIMADILNLPFKNNTFDLVYSLGVLHHLPINALGAVSQACECVKKNGLFLGYIYYALDNRPRYFSMILKLVNGFRRFLSERIKSRLLKNSIVFLIAFFVYKPMIYFGHILNLLGLASKVPLYEFYKGKSFYRIRQDVVDRFFTTIEQRYSKKEIAEYVGNHSLGDVVFSDKIPYWHFIVRSNKSKVM